MKYDITKPPTLEIGELMLDYQGFIDANTFSIEEFMFVYGVRAFDMMVACDMPATARGLACITIWDVHIFHRLSPKMADMLGPVLLSLVDRIAEEATEIQPSYWNTCRLVVKEYMSYEME